jgi:hypothetical protein
MGVPIETQFGPVVVVRIVTAPLLIVVPCAKIMEGKLLLHGTHGAGDGTGEQQQHRTISHQGGDSGF